MLCCVPPDEHDSLPPLPLSLHHLWVHIAVGEGGERGGEGGREGREGGREGREGGREGREGGGRGREERREWDRSET